MNEIIKTPITDDLSNLCRDYGSFINWASTKIEQYPNKGWSDLSISEPDTLTLSEIAVMHDYVQLFIDNLYVNANPEIATESFFRQLTAMMGLYTTYYNPHYLEVLITNNSETGTDPITIEAFSNFYIDNLLLTNPQKLIIPSAASVRARLVFGTCSTKIYSINKFINGEVYLTDKIETSSVVVLGSNGLSDELSTIQEESDIIPLITTQDLIAFQLTYRGENLYRLKLSPKALSTYKAIILQYTLVNEQNISEGIDITYSGSSDISVVVDKTAEFYINSRNDNLIKYYNSITSISEFNTSSALIDFKSLQSKITWYKLIYETNNSINIPKLLLITSDDKPLTGSGSNFDYLNINSSFTLKSTNPYTYNLELKFNQLPPYPISVNYDKYSIAILSSNFNTIITSKTPISYITIYNSQLGDLYKLSLSTVPEVVNTEVSELYQLLDRRYSSNYPALHLDTDIIVLQPTILQLVSQVTTTRASSTVNDIISVLESKFFTQVITDNIIMYSQLRALILREIPYITDIVFSSRRITVTKDQYLKLGDLQLYKSQIVIKEGDT